MPRHKQRHLIYLFLLVVGVLGIGLTDNPLARYGQNLLAAPKEGAPAPDFTLPDLGGTTMTLSNLRGQVVIINLWTAWCPPCREEMPALDAIYQQYQADGLVVLAVHSTIQDSEAAARAFAQELNLSFPILLDHEGVVTRRYQLQSLPTTFFVDRKGIIRFIVPGGPMSESLIRTKIAGLLIEKE